MPDSVTYVYEAGYYEGQKHAKVWLVTNDDVDGMYDKYPNGGEITLWCEGRSTRTKRKRDREEVSTRRQEREEEVKETYEKLRENKYSTPQLRLWSRMIASSQHESMEEPPNLPAFGGSVAKKTRRSYIEEAVSGAVSGAAATFAAFKSDPKRPNTDPVPIDSMLPSPGGTPNEELGTVALLAKLI